MVAALKIIFRFEVGDLRLEVYFCTAAEEDNKKTLTLEKKEHETLTLGKKATRAWKKVEKKNLRLFRSQKLSALSEYSVVKNYQHSQNIP